MIGAVGTIGVVMSVFEGMELSRLFETGGTTTSVDAGAVGFDEAASCDLFYACFTTTTGLVGGSGFVFWF